MTIDGARERILDAAEARARRYGYTGFSFRDVAADVGIKSASVHHHFPTKAALGAALAGRYAERTRARLGEPPDPASAVSRVAALFRASLVVADAMCLCGMLGAERDALPPEVAAATAGWFTMVLAWLERAFGPSRPAGTAEMVLAALEGALVLARTLGDRDRFERVAARLHALV